MQQTYLPIAEGSNGTGTDENFSICLPLVHEVLQRLTTSVRKDRKNMKYITTKNQLLYTVRKSTTAYRYWIVKLNIPLLSLQSVHPFARQANI